MEKEIIDRGFKEVTANLVPLLARNSNQKKEEVSIVITQLDNVLLS